MVSKPQSLNNKVSRPFGHIATNGMHNNQREHRTAVEPSGSMQLLQHPQPEGLQMGGMGITVRDPKGKNTRHRLVCKSHDLHMARHSSTILESCMPSHGKCKSSTTTTAH